MSTIKKYGCLLLALLLPFTVLAQEFQGSLFNDSTKLKISEVIPRQPVDVMYRDSSHISKIINIKTSSDTNDTFKQSSDFIPSYNTSLSESNNDSVIFNLSRDQLTERELQSILLQGYAAQEQLLNKLDHIGWRQGGNIANFGNLSIDGYRELEEHPNLLTVQRLNIDASYSTGNLSLIMGGAINQYYSIGLVTQFGIHGSLSYRFSSHVSATVFGDYYSKNPWFYMASFPYVNTARYGGYITLDGKRAGTRLGAERYYDPFVRRWEMRPIV